MSLTTCKECKREVSDSAKACPHCGVKDPGVTASQYVGGCLILLVLLVGGMFLLVGSSPSKTPSTATSSVSATTIVARHIRENKLGLTRSRLRVKDNPRGEGVFVYVPETRFLGVQRYFIWLVIDGRAFAINGASKGFTPSLSFPRDAPAGLWRRTGLDPYDASYAIKFVLGK